ncbi:unnamed protein product [Ilex paraguariensis]|uniref:Uncharacterized protein n=1 Tax=Ilex paraguariensis TaxID=185542 RepID=A0ABC8SLD6_9AQUA
MVSKDAIQRRKAMPCISRACSKESDPGFPIRRPQTEDPHDGDQDYADLQQIRQKLVTRGFDPSQFTISPKTMIHYDNRVAYSPAYNQNQ